MNEHTTPPSPTIQTLMAEALQETTDLARKEMALFRAEMSENVRKLVLGIVMFVVAAVFGIATLMLLTESVVEWLARVVSSRALAAFLVAVGTAIFAIGFALWGRAKMNSASMTPTHTARSLRRDAEVVNERVSA
jgi:uncharacterized membrane protein YqjE